MNKIMNKIMNKKDSDLKLLEDLIWMLTLRRKYNTAGDLKLCNWLDKIPGMTTDQFGNRILTVLNPDKSKPTILFSAHTDTVHHKKTGIQKVTIDAEKHHFFLSNTQSNCLGADDGAGVWLLTKLIANTTPGLYIFHRGEECGGLGSKYIAKETPEILKGIKHAIAFDRRGQKDIITRQSCGKCASEAFVKSLSEQLKMGHSSANGSFTDTSNYAGIIPECSNVSVGYEREHTVTEILNYEYLIKLYEALLKVDWTKLVVERETTDFGISSYNNYYRNRSYFNAKPKTNYLTIKDISKIYMKESPEVIVQAFYMAGITIDDVESAKQVLTAKKRWNNHNSFDEDYYGW